MTEQSLKPATPVAAARKRRWPDLSAYGIHFGVTIMPTGEQRLVMVDENASWGQLARQLGFVQSRWVGIYSKASARLDFPGMTSRFPLAKIVELTDDEIRRRIRPLMLAHKDRRLSQVKQNERRLSWHPKRTPVSSAAVEEIPAQPVNPEHALHQTIYLGKNFQGQDVFESGDSTRFIKAGDTVLATEGHGGAHSPMFMRASTDAELSQVAAGMVIEIMDGKHLKADDFIRYVEAVFGTDAANDKSVVSRFHAAIDAATRERVASMGGVTREVFDAALKLHDGRPSFWRADGEMPTPLPLAVAMQSIASAKATALAADGAPVTVFDFTGQDGSHSWSLDAETRRLGDYAPHQVALAGVFSSPIPDKTVAGVRVTRTDSEALLESLQQRADKGITVFLLSTPSAGKLDTEFKRVISAIGQTHEVSGLIDLDGAMFGAGNTIGSRILVVGDKRPAPDYTFAVPSEVPVVFEYEKLWNWAEIVCALDGSETLTFGDDGREENRWQAPYIPKSQISEPDSMCPRNLLGPVRKALARVVEQTGMGVDEFLCDRLGWTMAQLEERLSSEQADAVAIGIHAMDDKAGFVSADMTGLGKGRVAATLAAYARKTGTPVMFMTEKADLFSDFYRDVADIGCMDILGNPFILNSNLIVRDGASGAIIARSPDREQAGEILACGEFPSNYDMVLATYSQFNRDYDESAGAYRRRAAIAIRDLRNGSTTVVEALLANAYVMGLPNYTELANQVGSVPDAAFITSLEANNAAAARSVGDEAKAKEHDRRAKLPLMDPSEFIAELRPLIGKDFTTLKHQWAHSDAIKGALLILDESHVASGDSSRTGANLQAMVEKAGSVAYSSATYAKDIKNFRLYSRLFPPTLRVAAMSETLNRGGEPMQEIVSAMLAEDGRLIRREHDLSSIEFKVIKESDRYERNVAWANSFAGILAAMSELSGEVAGIARKLNDTEMAQAQAVAQAKATALAATAAASRGNMPSGNSISRQGRTVTAMPKATPKMGFSYTNFSSKLYNLSRAFAMSLTADLASDRAIEALKSGRKPVITVESTMETTLKELISGVELDGADQEARDALAQAGIPMDADPLAGVAESGALDGSEASAQGAGATTKRSTSTPLGRRVSFKDILITYIESMFGGWEYEYDEKGQIKSRKRVMFATPELTELGNQIREQIAAMEDIPLSPIDMVRDRITGAGFTVDEISGRGLRLVEDDNGNHVVETLPKRSKLKLKNDFNSGSLDALILSKSGSTGISLHANRTFADQSQRVLIELQPAADIAQRLQFWGRVNRKGQVCSPVVEMLSSGLPAENRLIAMQNNKLRRMSANTNGSSDNSAINENAPDILNKIGNEVCFRWMESNAKIASVIGFDLAEVDEASLRSSTKFVDMLTGRLMMFPVHMQEQIYKDITTEFNALMEQHEMEGRNPLKAAEFDLRARTVESKVIQVASGLESVFDQAVVASELEYDINLAALDRAAIEAEAEQGRSDLVANIGANWAKIVSDEFQKATEALYPSLLSQRYKTVEEALAAKETNAVQRAQEKAERLDAWLPMIEPGSLMWLGGERGSQTKEERDAASMEKTSDTDRMFITGVKIPATNKLSLASYKIVGWSLNKRKRVEVALSSVLSTTARTVYAPICEREYGEFESERKKSREFYDGAVDRFFSMAAKPYKGTARRVILEGNLYKAAELAESINTGQTVTYSDAKGVWHHAVLMPSRTTMRTVGNMPVIVSDAQLIMDAADAASKAYDERVAASNAAIAAANAAAAAAAAEKKSSITTTLVRTGWDGGLGSAPSVDVSDSFISRLNAMGQKMNSYSLRVSPHSASLSASVARPRLASAITSNAALLALSRDGKCKRERDDLVLDSMPGKTVEFVSEVLRVLESTETKVLLEGNMRAWYNEYIAQKTGLENTAAIPAAEVLKQEEEDQMELESLLSSAPSP